MGFVTISSEKAKFSHQDYYDGEFEVVPMTRSGWYDFPPFSWAYGISDFGSWGGLVSTDGKKIVVTQSKYADRDEIKNIFEISKSDIEKVEIGLFKTTLTLKNKVSKLTKGSVLTVLLITVGYAYILPGLILSRVLPSKLFQFRVSNEFKNLERFNALLNR